MTSTHDRAPSDSLSNRVPGQVCDRCRHFYEAEGIEQRRETPPDISQYATDTGYLQDAALAISPTNARTPRPLPFQPAAQGTILPTAPSSSGHQTSTAQVNEPVIGHMGRLVADGRQAPMFGGSTTGVHFISQAEQQLQLLHMHKDALPSCAYGLYLHSPWEASVHSPASPVVDIIAQLPPNTIEIVEATIDRWTPLYPIVHKSSTIDAIHGLLSSFSSAYHGMPRLIRDQDVDTDFPTSVDHNLLSRTHVEFPLPGERSQVDTAISLFKLARIIGRTLEDLYTTTRRRGGVAKIARLQAELNMWERVVLEPELESEPATSVTTKSLEATFLRVARWGQIMPQVKS
uniref:Transcription factor domain-containing protein n=1 Tax=Fusarium oxysporum (strain Fo5176) TaxID=660025 RepID=A0A0D2Y6K2_FUSOF